MGNGDAFEIVLADDLSHLLHIGFAVVELGASNDQRFTTEQLPMEIGIG